MGAWIETAIGAGADLLGGVAPHVGAWIETAINYLDVIVFLVAPHVGAWIETLLLKAIFRWIICRTPCGCVD